MSHTHYMQSAQGGRGNLLSVVHSTMASEVPNTQPIKILVLGVYVRRRFFGGGNSNLPKDFDMKEFVSLDEFVARGAETGLGVVSLVKPTLNQDLIPII